MFSSLSKIISFTLFALLGISVVFVILFYAGGYTPETVDAVYPEPVNTQAILVWSYILVFIATIAALGFPLARSISNPKNLKKAIVPAVATVVLVGISFLLSSGTPMKIVGLGVIDDPFTLKYTDTILITTYFLTIIAFLLIIYFGVVKLFKKNNN